MKFKHQKSTRPRPEKRRNLTTICIPIVLIAALPAGGASVDLGLASNFGVIAGSGITNTGATTIHGDIGSSPTGSITGFDQIILSGNRFDPGSYMTSVKSDLVNAFNTAAVQPADVTHAGAFDLVGLTLVPGVYQNASSYNLSGTLILDGLGNPAATWLIRAGTSLTIAESSLVNLINGARVENIFWLVGSSATLGTNSDFSGTVIALTSISVANGASVDGRLLALNGAVTLDNNTITVIPEPSSTVLLGLGIAALAMSGRCRRY